MFNEDIIASNVAVEELQTEVANLKKDLYEARKENERLTRQLDVIKKHKEEEFLNRR